MPLADRGFLGREIDTWIRLIREGHAAFFRLTDDISRYGQKAMRDLAPHKASKQEVLATALYIRVIHNYQAAILLAERGLSPQSKIMARAMIEALFTLCAICKDGRYADEFILEDQRTRLKFLRKFRDLHGGLPAEVNQAEVEALEKELKDEVKEKDIKEKSTEQWATDAGMRDWYLTAYAVFSASVHSKVKDLERYLVLGAENEITELRAGPDDDDIEKVLMGLNQGMLTALRCVFGLFKLGRDEELNHMQEQLDKLTRERLVGPE